MRGGKGVISFSWLFLLFFSAVNIWSHVPTGPYYDHIDAYKDTGLSSEPFDLVCPDGSGNPTGGGAAPLISTNTPAIDYSGGDVIANQGAAATRVLFVLRHSTWAAGGTTNNHCQISEVTFDIKRLKLSQSQLTRETVRTFSFQNLQPQTNACPMSLCIPWDGFFAVDQTGYGRVNGAYEATAKMVYKTTESITLEVNMQYPGVDNSGSQFPVTIDVMDIHSIISSPTYVGASRIPAFPVIMTYKLSKTGYVVIDIVRDSLDACGYKNDDFQDGKGPGVNPDHRIDPISGAECTPRVVRRLVDNQQRWGEDTTQGSQGNMELWDGRGNDGARVSSGVYVVVINAWDPDSGDETDHSPNHDAAITQTFSISLDPFQIVDLTVQPLTTESTSYAGVGFVLTDAATVYFDIWKSSAVFGDINAAPSFTTARPSICTSYACPGMKVRHYENNFPGKSAASIVWDGRDSNGTPVEDGNYVFSIWGQEAEMSGSTTILTTSKFLTGIIPITRGLVPISQVQASYGILPSSPLITGIAPYSFSYFLGRDALVNLKVLASNGQYVNSLITGNGFNNGQCALSAGCVVTTLVNREVRPGKITITDPITNGWDGRAFNGVRVSSGVYMVELNAIDTFFPNRVSTITAFFPVDTLRVGGGAVAPILQTSTETARISYVLSEPMDIEWSIYPPTTTFTGGWPNITPIISGSTVVPVRVIKGPRPGRTPLIDFWDGTNANGLFVNDGVYISVFKASDSYGNVATDALIKEVPVSRGQILILNPQIVPTFPEVGDSTGAGPINIPLEPFEINYVLSRDASITITVTDRDGVLIRKLVDNEPRAGFVVNREFWDGTNFAGIRLTTAAVLIEIFADDQTGISSSSSTYNLQSSLDLLRIYDPAVAPLLPDSEAAELSYQLSESMDVDIRIYKPGTQFNLAGQPYPAESESLVFRIFGPRPGRTPITESWEGINTFQKQVPDGNYVFRLTARDGQGRLASDILTGNLDVFRLGFVDPQGTFDDQTFAYPNPATKSPVKICTVVPIDANVTLKIYTLNGDLVWDRNIGFKQGGTSLCGTSAIEWNLENSWGKRIARGVYFYILRADSVGGATQFLQTKKKILIP